MVGLLNYDVASNEKRKRMINYVDALVFNDLNGSF